MTAHHQECSHCSFILRTRLHSFYHLLIFMQGHAVHLRSSHSRPPKVQNNRTRGDDGTACHLQSRPDGEVQGHRFEEQASSWMARRIKAAGCLCAEFLAAIALFTLPPSFEANLCRIEAPCRFSEKKGCSPCTSCMDHVTSCASRSSIS